MDRKISLKLIYTLELVMHVIGINTKQRIQMEN